MLNNQKLHSMLLVRKHIMHIFLCVWDEPVEKKVFDL